MSEETFRIVITAAVGFACLGFVVQACVVIAMYSTARKMQKKLFPLVERLEPLAAKVEPMLDRVGVVVEKLGPAVDKLGPMAEKATLFLASANRTVEETRPKIGSVLTSANRALDDSGPKVERSW